MQYLVGNSIYASIVIACHLLERDKARTHVAQARQQSIQRGLIDDGRAEDRFAGGVFLQRDLLIPL
ncbi:MAG: hypothetical protein M1546_05315 [Chloroflexi bacterium]|nr:hypothetical protein [Chloroflexota bacterium]